MTATVPAGARAQTQAPRDTLTAQLWQPAAEIHEIKDQFVRALRQVVETLAGASGDEARQLSAGLDALDRTRARWDDAIRDYEAALARMPDSAERHVALGTVYLDRHRVDDAVNELAAAGRIDPRRPDVHSLSAMAFALDNRFDAAAEALRSASALEGGANPITLYGLAQHLIRGGHRDQAAAPLRAFHEAVRGRAIAADENARPSAPFERVGLLRQVAGVAPIFPLHAYRNAFRLLLTGRYEPAVAELRRAASEDAVVAGDERSRLARADVLLDAGRLAEARQLLEETVAQLPGSGSAYYRLGQIAQRLSLLPRAVEAFEAAAARDPLVGVDRLYETIGALYSNQADFDAVVDAYVKRIDANPNYADGHVRLGEIYFLQGADDEALAEFAAALLIEPSNTAALAGAGQVFSRTGRYADAVAAARRAIALDEGHRGAHYALGTSLMRLGQVEEGKRELEIFQRLQADAIAAAQRQR